MRSKQPRNGGVPRVCKEPIKGMFKPKSRHHGVVTSELNICRPTVEAIGFHFNEAESQSKSTYFSNQSELTIKVVLLY